MLGPTTFNPVASDKAVQYLRCHLSDGIGPVLLARIIKEFGTLDAALGASMTALQRVEGIGERRARAFFEARNNDNVSRELDRAAQVSARIICWEDDEYPTQLRHVNDPPVCLYIRGRIVPEDAVAIAIVGSRKCSRYGCEQAQRFATLLTGAGFTIVSGLARGIDGYAQEAAVKAGGRTIGVLGCGVDVIYPPEHRELAEQVIAQGAIISEDPMGSSPTADSFPKRNRIIAGMSLGVIVVEASKRSGALITARLATEYNREVFAIPGRVDTPTSLGTNDLIRSGSAKLAASLEDVIDELGDVGQVMAKAGIEDASRKNVANATLATLSEQERPILDALGDDELHIDQITVTTGLAPSAVASALTLLQLKGLIVSLPGSRYARRSR